MRYFIFLYFLFLQGVILAQTSSTLEAKIKQLKHDSPWRQVSASTLLFPSYHPQGMVKIGDYFFMSSVEVRKAPKSGDTGEGIGHLFKFDSTGKLIAQITLGEGSMYHPGGIDYDGKNIWVPVAEYRPNSQSIIYKINPNTLTATEILRYPEHIGAIVHDTDKRFILGMSWGSRNFYQWKLSADGKVKNSTISPEQLRIPNPSFYIDYQDCHYIGHDVMLCGGLQKYTSNDKTFRLGGLDLINLKDFRPIHQVPIRLWSPTGSPMTNNPFWIEATTTGLRAYFVPDDDKAATFFVYDVFLK